VAPGAGTQFVTVEAAEYLDLLSVIDLCARRRAEALVLFETLGGWTRSDDSYAPLVSADDPFSRDGPTASAVRRRFAAVTHRHAWHAELWAARMPMIPGVDVLERTATARARIDIDDLTSGESAGRRQAYATRLRTIVSGLDDVAARTHADLDPATLRVIDLVRPDLLAILDGRF
jgi:hypothetical protein